MRLLTALLLLAAPAFSAPNRSTVPGVRVPGVPGGNLHPYAARDGALPGAVHPSLLIGMPRAFDVPQTLGLMPGAPLVPALPAALALPGPKDAVVPGAPVPEGPRAADQLKSAAADGGKSQTPRERLDASYDGSAQRGAAPPVDPAVAAGAQAPELFKVGNKADRAWIGAVVAEASRSKEARRVLDEVRALVEKRGRPVQVIVRSGKESASFDYDWDVVSMDTSHLKRTPVEAASVFIHELQHVLQRAKGFIPTDALEMELESYIVDITVDRELGLPRPKRGSFNDKLLRALARGPDAVVRFIQKEYPDNVPLHGSSREEYLANLHAMEATSLRRIARVERELERRREALEAMIAAGQPARAIESYREDEIEPRERKIKREKKTLRWIRRDVVIVTSEEGYRRFKEYSDAVIKRLRRLAAGR